MEKSYKQILTDAGRYEGVVFILNVIINLPESRYPVSPYVLRDGSVHFDVPGENLREQARHFLNRLESESDLGDSSLYTDLEQYLSSQVDIMLHNYANHLSHKIEPDIDMEDIRTWSVLNSLMASLAWSHEEWPWEVSEGWKALSNTPTMTM